MSSPVSYRDIFITLAKNKVRYLVAGGIAVNLHQVQRATMDLDLILHLKKDNIKKFVHIMKQLGFKPRLPVSPDDLADPQVRQRWAQEKNMVVFSFIRPQNPFEVIDIFIEEPKDFQQLYKNKLVVKAFGVTIPVLGLDDLIELKQKVGRDTDLFDVAQLSKLKKKPDETA